MAWSALIRSWNRERKMYDQLILRIEETQEPGCLVRLYDGDHAAGESVAETPQLAVRKAIELAQAYLKDPSLSDKDLDWMQM